MMTARARRNQPAFIFSFCAWLCALLLMAFSYTPANAQDSYNLKKIDLPAPFKYAEIRFMTRDAEGYLWFVTSQGVWRFDGTNVESFSPHDPQFPESALPDFVHHYNKFLLLSYQLARQWRLLVYNVVNKKITSYVIDGTPSVTYKDGRGALIFYTLKGYQWQLSPNGELKNIGRVPNVAGWNRPDAFDHLFRDADGAVYLFSTGSVARYKGGKIFFNKKPVGDSLLNAFKFNFVRSVYATQRYILAGLAVGFIIYDKATLMPVYFCNNDYDALTAIENGKLLVLAPANQQPKPVAGMFDVKTVEVSASGGFKVIVDDPAGNSLIGTSTGIYELTKRSDDKGQKAVTDFFRDKSVRSIYRLKNGKMYIGSYSGLFAVEDNRVKLVASYIAYSMYQVNDTTMVLGGEGGKGFSTLNTRTDKRTDFNDDARYMCGFCLAGNDGNLFGGTGSELYQLMPKPNSPWELKKIIAADDLLNTKQLLRLNGHWLISGANGLFWLDDNNHLEKIFPKNEKYAVYGVLPQGDNFWLGTGGHGLIEIDRKGNILRQIRFSGGLAGDYVYSLYKINGLLYAGTNEGLSVFDMNADMRSIDGPDDPQYSEEFNHSAVFYDKYRQQLILGGVRGLLFPDMEYYKRAQQQKTDQIRLSYVKRGAGDGAKPEIDLFAGNSPEISLETGYTFMGLKFSGADLWRQGNFLFRLNEIDTAWHKSSLATEISLYGLAPGKYTLQARLPSGANPSQWLVKTIVVMPYFYQTLWFKLLIAAIIGVLIYLAWLVRAGQIRNEHLIRTTIASDLHDEIGSALTRISYSSELMNIKQELDNSVVEKISADSKGAIASISDIIWSVDARNDTKDDLLLRIKEHAYDMLEGATAIHFKIQGLDKVATLPQLVRQNIYLVFKEAVNNIARHNISPEVWISLDNQVNGMLIIIKNTIDAGKPKSPYTGQGTRNMQMRIKRVKGTVDIQNDGKLYTLTIRMRRW